MHCNHLAILLVCITAANTKLLRLPPYFERCSKSAPDFDDCCLRSGRKAIPRMREGDAEYNIPNMLPMNVPLISVQFGSDFSLYMKNIRIYGLETLDLVKVKFDLKNQTVYGQIHTDKLEMIGDYEVDGRLLIIPIQGKGALNTTLVGWNVDYTVNYTLQNRDGEDYIKISKGAVGMTLERAYFDLTNLFNGNKQLGESTNKVLNDEWKQLMDTLNPIISKTFVDLLNKYFDSFLQNIPYSEFFLE